MFFMKLIDFYTIYRRAILSTIGVLLFIFIALVAVKIIQINETKRVDKENIQKILKDVEEKKARIVDNANKEIRFMLHHSQYTQYDSLKSKLQPSLNQYAQNLKFEIFASMDAKYKNDNTIVEFINTKLTIDNRELFLRYDAIIKDEIDRLKQTIKHLDKKTTPPKTLVRKYALVIGNSSYPIGRLNNPINDANALANSLKMLSFEVDLVVDGDLKSMQSAIDNFSAKLHDEDIVLFFYAGHAVQYQEDNYLLPLEANQNIKNSIDLTTQAISVSSLLKKLDKKSKLKIIILDACRTSPLQVLALQDGLARSVVFDIHSNDDEIEDTFNKFLSGTLIAYSTSPGNIAHDGNGKHSPYVKYLIQNIMLPNFTIENVLKKTRANVEEETIGTQIPWYESSINGDFYPAQEGTMEFLELLNLLALPKDNQNNTWQYLATIPIDWDKKGLVVQKEYYQHLKEGRLKIKNSGIFSHYTIASTQEPVKWNIKIVGTRTQYTTISLSNPIFIDITQPYIGELVVPQKYLKESKIVCHNDVFPTDETIVRLQTLEFPYKHPIGLITKEYCRGLKRNCNYEYTLYPSRENIQKDPIIRQCQEDKQKAQTLFTIETNSYPNIQKLSNQMTIVQEN